MITPNNIYDAETVAVMGRAFDDAWSETLSTTMFPSAADETAFKAAMAQLILSAAANGVRDYVLLKTIALGT